jgi:O-antigen/teichoic acid export membrane protein/glycosyltransferase involved in cell wall biosynthesis
MLLRLQRTLRSWRQDRLLRGILKNSGYLFSSNSVAVILTFFQGILTARLLGEYNYGLLIGIVIVFVTNVNRLLSFRMSEVVVKYLGQALLEGKKERAAAVVKGLGMVEALTSVAAYLVLLLLTPLAARYFAKDLNTIPLFIIYGLVLLSYLVYETSTGILQTTGRFDRIALINLVQSVITASLILLVFLTKGGIMGVLLAYLLGKTFSGIAVALFAAVEMQKILGPGWQRAQLSLLPDWRNMLKFAISTNLNGTVNLFARDSETLLISLFRSPAEVGYFRLAQGLINLVMLPIEPFISPTYAEITRTVARRGWGVTRRLLKQVSSISGLWTLLAGIALALAGRWLIPLVYGPRYAPAYPALLLLLVGYGFASIFQWNRPLLLALGMPAFPLVIMTIVGLVKTGLTFLFVPILGYLSEAVILSSYFIISISMIVSRGLSEIKIREKGEGIRDQAQASDQEKTPDRGTIIRNSGEPKSTIKNLKSKIICISASQVPSSTANSIQVMKACGALAELGYEVRLLAPGKSVTSWEELASFYGLQAPFEVEWLPAIPALKRYDFSVSALRRAQALGADMLYTWLPQAAGLALFGKLPVLFELHGIPEGKLGPAVFRLFLRLRPVSKRGVAGNKRLLPITQALVGILERDYRYRFSSCEVVVSPNGVDLGRYLGLPSPSEARCALGLPDTLTVGYTGHLYAGRGLDLMVELARRMPQVNFIWVGGRPSDVESWRKYLEEEGIANISLLGFIENSRLPLYQAAAEILLMPYERQIAGSSGGNSADYCSPMKMFEYMACGRAIITSNLPVIREVLDDSTALFCPPEDIHAWEAALRSLIADNSLRERLANNAWQKVQEYSWTARETRALEGFLDG